MTTPGGRTIFITIDEDDFVIEAARTRPEPLVDIVRQYAWGTGVAAAQHPLDVNIGYWYAATWAGAFDWLSSRASGNARFIARIFLDNTLPTRSNPAQSRLAAQILLLYLDSDLRGKIFVQFAARQYYGGIFSLWLHSFNGRITPWYTVPSNIVLSAVGAIYRVCMRIARHMNTSDLTGHIVGPETFMNAILTGDDDIIDIVGAFPSAEQYFAIRNYLLANPHAIEINRTELRAIEWLLDQAFEFFAEPESYMSGIEELTFPPDFHMPVSP
ncbi:MAG: hypothetical protein WCZ72_01070 [Gemmobacter sp.]